MEGLGVLPLLINLTWLPFDVVCWDQTWVQIFAVNVAVVFRKWQFSHGFLDRQGDTVSIFCSKTLCHITYKTPVLQKTEQISSVCVYVVFACTNHSIWAEGIHPFLYQGLHVVLSEVLALLLLFETDETWRVTLLPFHQLFLWVGWSTLGPIATQTLLQVPMAKMNVFQTDATALRSFNHQQQIYCIITCSLWSATILTMELWKCNTLF